MNTNNYLSSYFLEYYGKLIPSIENIRLIMNYVKKYNANPKMMYHLYPNESYIDFILVENGIEQITCLEPNSDTVRNMINIRKKLRSPNKDLVTIYNINPLSNEFVFSDADVIFISFQSEYTNIMSKINNDCKNNTIIIIESYTIPSIQLNCIHKIFINDLISIYIYKL